MNTNTSSGIGFLSVKNEKVQKWLGLAPFIAAGLGIWYYLLPFVATLLTGTLYVAALGTILVIFGMLVTNPKVLWTAGFLLQRFIDLGVSSLVRRDPIGVMKYYLREVDRKIEELRESLSDINGALIKANRDCESAQEDLEREEGKVLAAKNKGQQDSPSAKTAASIALRRRKVVDRITEEITQGKKAQAILSLILERAVAKREDLADNIMSTEAERKRVKTTARGFRAAMQILKNGQSPGAEMYDEAVESNNEELSALMGEMDQFVFESRGITEGFALERDGAVEQVLARLEQKSGTSTLLLEHQPQAPNVLESISTRAPQGAIVIDDFLKH